MGSWLQDCRYTVRALVGRPGYALVTVLVLTVAIGANATMFGVLNGLILKPLPYPDDGRLVAVYNTYTKMGLENVAVSVPDYLDRRDQAPSLESIAIFNTGGRLLAGEDRPEQLLVARASPSLFGVLEVPPLLGRVFTEEEGTIGNDRVAVLSYRLWNAQFGGSDDIVGSDIRLDGESFRVVGVMPESFTFPNTGIDVWVPFAFTPQQMSDQERGMEYSNSIGRLREGATVAGLNAEMDAIVDRSLERLPDRRAFIETSGFTGRALPLKQTMVGNLEALLLLLQGLVLAVLLIACANVANLQLARVATRRTEISVRAALGASRARLARLILLESFMLALLGACGGLALCAGALAVLQRLGLGSVGIGFEFTIDSAVLVYTLAAAAVATIVTGLFPLAAMLRDDRGRIGRDGNRVAGGLAAHRFRGGLVVFQIAASVALLVSAGLLAKSFYRLASEDPGFATEGTWTARVVLPRQRYAAPDAMLGFYDQMLDALRALPGVSEVGLTSNLPFSNSTSQGSYEIRGYTPPAGEAPPHANQRSINEEFLPSLDVPVLMGRNFARSESEPVAIVDQLFVNRYFPNGNALGQRIANGGRPDGAEPEWFTIVGIVPVVHHDTLAVRPTKETIYWHYRQQPRFNSQVTLKTTLPPEQVARMAADAVSGIDRDVLLANGMTMQARVAQSLGPQGTAMTLTLVFAGGALVLAVIGVYGVLIWSVTQRVGEIGVRMALGAQGRDIVAMVLRQGGRFIGAGVILGVGFALLIGFAISSQIYEVSAADPGVFAAAVTVIVAAAIGASWLPALRAAAVDPMQALRNQ